MKKNYKYQEEKFYGTTTLGQKGQLVVPVAARKKLYLKIGEKLLVFSGYHNMLVIAKLTDFHKLARQMSRQLANISRVVKGQGKKR